MQTDILSTTYKILKNHLYDLNKEEIEKINTLIKPITNEQIDELLEKYSTLKNFSNELNKQQNHSIHPIVKLNNRQKVKDFAISNLQLSSSIASSLAYNIVAYNEELQKTELKSLLETINAIDLISIKINKDMQDIFDNPKPMIFEVSIVNHNERIILINKNNSGTKRLIGEYLKIPEVKTAEYSSQLVNDSVILIQKLTNCAIEQLLTNSPFNTLTEENYDPYSMEYNINRETYRLMQSNGGFNLDLLNTNIQGTNLIYENLATRIAIKILGHNTFKSEFDNFNDKNEYGFSEKLIQFAQTIELANINNESGKLNNFEVYFETTTNNKPIEFHFTFDNYEEFDKVLNNKLKIENKSQHTNKF